MSILNSHNTRFILHKYTESKLPHATTWNAIISQWINSPYLDNKTIDLIRYFWKPNDITVKKGELKSLIFTPQNTEYHQYYNIYLDKNSTLKCILQNNNNTCINIIVYNDIIIHKNAQLFITGNITNIHIKCYGMIINKGKIMTDNGEIKYCTDNLNYISNDLISSTFDITDIILRNCFSKNKMQMTNSAIYIKNNINNKSLQYKLRTCTFTPIFYNTLNKIGFINKVNNKYYLKQLHHMIFNLILSDVTTIVCNQTLGNNVLTYMMNTIDTVDIIKWNITSEFWSMLNQFCNTIKYGQLSYLPKILKICSIIVQHYNEQILSNVFIIYDKLTALNKEYNIFDMDLVVNGNQYIDKYNRTQNALFCKGYIRQIIGDKAIPMQIQSLILMFDSVLLNTQIDIDIFNRLTELFDFQLIGTNALKCIAHIFDIQSYENINTNKQQQIDYLLEKDITRILFDNLANKTIDDVILDKNNHKITNVLHIINQILTIIPDKALQYIEEYNVIYVIENLIQNIKSMETVMPFPSNYNQMKYYANIDNDIVMNDEYNTFNLISWDTFTTQKQLPKVLSETGLSETSSVNMYMNIELQFEITYILLIIATHCENKQSYVNDVINWFKWFEDNIFDIQCQKLLKCEKTKLKLYKMAQFENKQIQSYVTNILITYGTESNEQLRLKQSGNDCIYNGMNDNISFDLYPRVNLFDICIKQCMSDDSTNIRNGLRYLHGAVNDMTKHTQLVNSGVITRLLDLLNNNTFDMSLRIQAAITLLRINSFYLIQLMDNTFNFNNLMRFLVKLFSNKLCVIKIKKNADGILSNDIYLEIIYNGGFVDIIDIDIIDLIGHFGKYFEYSMSYQTLDFIEFMYSISRLDIWCLPIIWSKFVDSKFIPKLRKCYLSNNINIKQKASMTFVHFVNQVNVMGVHDLCPIAIRPSIDLLSSKCKYNQQLALESMSKLVIGQPLNVYMSLDYKILYYLIPIIIEHINIKNNTNKSTKILTNAINVLLHLSDPNIDKKHLVLILDGLSIATNFDSYASLEMLCRIYAQFTHPNYIKINQNVIDYIIQSTMSYNKYDILLVNGYLKTIVSDSEMDIPMDVIECCLSFSRLYGNVLQFLVNSIDFYHSASTALYNVMKIGNECVIKSILDHNGCEKLIKFIDSKPYRGLDNATLILLEMTESPAYLPRIVPDIIPYLTGLLVDDNDPNILENVMWTIGNVAKYSTEYRDILLDSLLLNYLVYMCNNNSKILSINYVNNTITAINWILTNICNKGVFNKKYLAPILKILSICLTKTSDSLILEDICWICSDLTEQFEINKLIKHETLINKYNKKQNMLLITGYYRRIDNIHIIPNDVVIETLQFNTTFNISLYKNPLISPMINLLKIHSPKDVRNVALKVVGNIVASGSEATQCLINNNLLKRLNDLTNKISYNLYAKDNQSLQSEIYWIFSNICAGSQYQIQLIIDANIFDVLKDVLHKSLIEYKVAKYAFYAISNAILKGTKMQIQQLIWKNITFPIFKFMETVLDRKVIDIKLMIVLLETIEKILFSANEELATQLMDKCNGMEVLNELKIRAGYKECTNIQQSLNRILKLSIGCFLR